MRRTSLLLLCVAVLVLAAVAAPSASVAGARSVDECLELGFDKDIVRCKHCEKLFLITQSAELRQECVECCTPGADDEAEKEVAYVAARIEGRGIHNVIGRGNLNPLALFSQNYQEEPYFAKVTYVDKFAAMYPQVVLVGSDGKDAMTLRIGGWSPETIHEFLKKKLRVAE